MGSVTLRSVGGALARVIVGDDGGPGGLFLDAELRVLLRLFARLVGEVLAVDRGVPLLDLHDHLDALLLQVLLGIRREALEGGEILEHAAPAARGRGRQVRRIHVVAQQALLPVLVDVARLGRRRRRRRRGRGLLLRRWRGLLGQRRERQEKQTQGKRKVSDHRGASTQCHGEDTPARRLRPGARNQAAQGHQ
jgi:hypothetical protein